MDSKLRQNIRIAIIVLCVIAFFPVFKADFVNYDDPEYILNNPYIRSFSFENIKHIFSGKATDLYVPLTIFSYLTEYTFFGESAKVFHSVNLLLHIINALLLFTILLKLNLKNNYLIYFILLFFTLNPLITESVCWITERKDVLYCLFYFLAIGQFLKHMQHKQLNHLLACFILFILSCLSKPMAVSLPVLFSIYMIYTQQKFKLKDHLPLIPFYVISAVSSLISVYSLSRPGPIKANIIHYNILEKAVLVFSEIGYYFIKPFIPFNQQLFHIFPLENKLLADSDIRFFAFAGALIAGLICYQVFSKKNRLPGYLFLAWLVFLAPVLQIYSNTHSYVSERYVYVSVIFPVTIVWLLIQKLSIKTEIYKYTLIIITFAFIFLTFKRSTAWKNSETLFEAELKTNPKSTEASNNLGYYYNVKGDFFKAGALLKTAVEADSTNTFYLNNYGWALANTGETELALFYFEKAIHLNPTYTEALNNMGIAYMQKREVEKAAGYFKRAYTVSPANADVVFNLGLYYYNSNQKKIGLPLLKKAYDLGNKKALKYLNR